MEALSKRCGVSHSTLSRWKLEAGIVGDMSKKKIKTNERRSDDRTPEEKLQLVLESSQLKDNELGEFLRKNGVHEALLQRWKSEALGGLNDSVSLKSKKRSMSPEAKELRELKNKMRRAERDFEDKLKRKEKEILRKDKALAETAALIVLKKKAEILWGVEDDDTE